MGSAKWPSNSQWGDEEDDSPFPPPSNIQAKTLIELFFTRAEEYPKKTFLRYRDPLDDIWMLVSWREAAEQVAEIASTLKNDHNIQSEQAVALLCDARHESILIELALLALGAVSIPLGKRLSSEETKQVLGELKPALVITEHENVNGLPKGSKQLNIAELTVSTSENPDQLIEWAKNLSEKVKPTDTACIFAISADKYLTRPHKQQLAITNSILLSGLLHTGEACLLYFPISSAFGRTFAYAVIALGGDITFPTPSDREHSSFAAENFLPDIKQTQPKVIICPPRLLENIHRGLHPSPSRTIRERLSRWALELKENQPSTSKENLLAKLKSALAREILSQLRNSVFGSRLQHIVSHGPSLEKEILIAYKSLGALVCEMSWSEILACPISANTPKYYVAGSRGRLFSSVEVLSNADQLLQLRGPLLGSDSYLTSEVIVELDSEGFIKIRD